MAPGFGTPSVAVATTPTVISTFFSHILASHKRKSKSKKSLAHGGPGGGPEEQLAYEEGIKVVRRFLEFASTHGVEEVQAFTAMRVPHPHWVRKEVVTIPIHIIERAEGILAKHLASYGPAGGSGGGLQIIGGSKWWKVRGKELEGEWIEMQKDYIRRTSRSKRAANTSSSSTENAIPPINPTTLRSYLPRRQGTIGSVKDGSGTDVTGDRVILYIHGGAFFFSSLDTHRYQIQRHARKAGARAFAPSYRLAPQYPFPCGLLDALASYLFLLDPPPGAHAPILPTSIIFMGDSAGAGMVVSLLVLIREMGLPMPAGASLISPWVDLTHSMPSIQGWDGGDYIPSSGFHYKPSLTWPPLPGSGITVTLPDGKQRHFDEQIQMYCPNNLLTHPLVSPVNMGSLGGLCPLLIVGGGAELLRDEMIYLAHKAAAPTTYPPSSVTLAQYPDQAALVAKYPPTKVHLQIYEGCCHVTTTLSITRSAKYMYRACANFNIWALTAASKALVDHIEHPRREHKRASSVDTTPFSPSTAKTHPHRSSTLNTTPSSATTPGSPVTSTTDSPSSGTFHGSTAPTSAAASSLDLNKPIINPKAAVEANTTSLDTEDVESEASSDSDESDRENRPTTEKTDQIPPTGTVSVRGIEPSFGEGYLVSERVSTYGKIHPFEPISEIPALNPKLREHIGQIHGDGAIKKWLIKRAEWDEKYKKSLDKYREIRKRDREIAEKRGFLTGELKNDNPPLCSLAGLFDKSLAREVGRSVDETSTKTNMAVGLWMRTSSKADAEHAGGENLEDIEKNVKSDGEDEHAASKKKSEV